jgi:ribosome-binding factor A
VLHQREGELVSNLMSTRRQRQVAELLHQEISLLIQRQVRDPRLGFVTITDVEVTPDLRLAHVYVSVMGGDDEVKQAMAGLKSAAGFFRHELGSTLSLRFTPELSFRLDKSLEQGFHIDQLLDSLHAQAPADDDEGDAA